MQTPLEQALRDQLRAYISGACSLRQFHEWFVAATSDIDESGDAAATDLTYEIELRLAEYSYGHQTEARLREILHPLTTSPIMSAAH